MLLEGREREGGRGRKWAGRTNGRSECVANTMHISHCSLPSFFRQESTILQSAALDCNSLGTRSMRPCLAWLQSKQNWPFLRLYLSLSFSYISFFLSGYPPRVPKQREEVPRFPSEKGEGRGLRQPTHRVFQPMVEHARRAAPGAVSRTNLHAVEDSHRGREKILPGMTKICK